MRTIVDPAKLVVTRNPEANRFESTIAGQLAQVDYRISGHRMIITHTEVPEPFRGNRIAEHLLAFAVESARKDGLEVVAECSYAEQFLKRHQVSRRPTKSDPSVDTPL